MEFPAVKVGPVTFSAARIEDAIEATIKGALAGRGQNLRFSNAYCVGLANHDENYRRALESPGHNFADGLPVAWLVRRASGLAGSLASFRVRGPSFFEAVVDAGSSQKIRHSFVGATPSTLALLEDWISREYPEAIVAGTYAPPFGEVNEEFVDNIGKFVVEQEPHVVWLGLGTPKQDLTAMKLAEKFPNLTIASVGAAFDFKAGVVREAPDWVQRSGIEWLYRLLSEPKRLWHRYTVGSLRFFQAILSPKTL